jgi:hypothetical protein
MATSAETAVALAVGVAEATRQQAKSAAFSAYNFNPAGLSTYNSAVITADVNFLNSVTSAATANGISPNAARAGPECCVGECGALTNGHYQRRKYRLQQYLGDDCGLQFEGRHLFVGHFGVVWNG